MNGNARGQNTKAAKQPNKGAPRAGDASDRTLPAKNSRNYEDAPSATNGRGRGTPSISKPMGEN